MGKQGPKPQPPSLKLVHGNLGKRPIPTTGEVRPVIRLPSCPKFLKGEARREWRRLGAHLLAHGLVTDLDRGALVMLCVAWGRHVAAEEALAATT